MLKKLISPLLSTTFKESIRRRLNRIQYYGRGRECPVCGCGVRTFLPHGIPVEEQALCPICGSKAPHRLAAVYFHQHPELFIARGDLVHIAPERELGKQLALRARSAGMRYRSGSIGGSGESFLDILHLPFPDNSIHLIYCCHVLNSMQDDRGAMREVYRVLHPAGAAILQVPAFYDGPTTLEPETEAEQVEAFHVSGISRCYTSDDYERRLRDAGFQVSAFWARAVSPEVVQRHELKGEVLHICRKPGSGRAG